MSGGGIHKEGRKKKGSMELGRKERDELVFYRELSGKASQTG